MNDEIRDAADLLTEFSTAGEAAKEWATLNEWGVRLPATTERIGHCRTNRRLVARVLPITLGLDVGIPLTSLSTDDADELANELGANSGEQNELRGILSGVAMARWLLERDGAATLEVRLDPPWKFWLRSADDHDALLADWLKTAHAAEASSDLHFANIPAEPVSLVGVPVVNSIGRGDPDLHRPIPARADRGAPQDIAKALGIVADLACWMHLAHSIGLSESGVHIALHEHQQAFKLTPDRLHGSPESLLRWATSTPDPLREEALRHTLRLATAATPDLPNADQTVRSAAQYLLLFSQNRSAEVLRARDSAMTSVKGSIAEVTASIDESQRDAARDALAAVLSAVGLIAASSRLGAEATVGGLIVVIVTVVALMWTTTTRRISRMASAVQELEAEVTEAETSPFLTPDDVQDLNRRAGLETHRRNRDRTRRVLIAVAVVAVISTAAVAALGFSSPPGGSTSTGSSSPTATPTSLGP